MGILLRILGVIWIIAGALIVAAAVVGVSPDASAGNDAAHTFGAIIGAGIVAMPIWLTGIAFFLLPGWIRKQLASKQTDIFA
ncbi:hypothetical protein [Hyphomonas sp.]|uniref:hypothetical protein n=1 Tax=Hyphomonas sp. TaxID=87 RepID=UPI001BD0E995|nr:hypothetical protein [Hyphomonas sp.]